MQIDVHKNTHSPAKKPDNNKQTNKLNPSVGQAPKSLKVSTWEAFSVFFSFFIHWYCILFFYIVLFILYSIFTCFASKITHFLTSTGQVNHILTLSTEISNRFIRFLIHKKHIIVKEKSNEDAWLWSLVCKQ